MRPEPLRYVVISRSPGLVVGEEEEEQEAKANAKAAETEEEEKDAEEQAQQQAATGPEAGQHEEGRRWVDNKSRAIEMCDMSARRSDLESAGMNRSEGDHGSRPSRSLVRAGRAGPQAQARTRAHSAAHVQPRVMDEFQELEDFLGDVGAGPVRGWVLRWSSIVLFWVGMCGFPVTLGFGIKFASVGLIVVSLLLLLVWAVSCMGLFRLDLASRLRCEIAGGHATFYIVVGEQWQRWLSKYNNVGAAEAIEGLRRCGWWSRAKTWLLDRECFPRGWWSEKGLARRRALLPRGRFLVSPQALCIEGHRIPIIDFDFHRLLRCSVTKIEQDRALVLSIAIQSNPLCYVETSDRVLPGDARLTQQVVFVPRHVGRAQLKKLWKKMAFGAAESNARADFQI